jgi:hypothetical protein
MKRAWSLILVLMLGLCLTGRAEALPQTIEKSVPLEGQDETRTYTLVQDAQGRFSIYIDEDIYEAVQNDAGMTIQQKGGGASMTLIVQDGAPAALRKALVTPEIKQNESYWAEDFDKPYPGCSVIYDQEDKSRSLYWFDMGGGKALQADFSLLPEEQEGHGVRMWSMLETLVF